MSGWWAAELLSAVKHFIPRQASWALGDFSRYLLSSSSAWKQGHFCPVLCRLSNLLRISNVKMLYLKAYMLEFFLFLLSFFFKITDFCILITWWGFLLSQPSDVLRWSDLAFYYKIQVLFVFSVSLSNPFSFSSIRRAGSTAFPFREVFSELRSLLINYRLVGWLSPSDCQSATCITTDSRCLSHGFILTLPSKLIRVRASRDSVRPGLLGRFWLHRQSPSEAT